MRLAMMIVTLMALAGCAQYDAARQANLAATADARVTSDDTRCRSSGLQPASPAYEDCRKRLENLHAQESRSQNNLANQMLNESSLRPFGQ